MSVKKETFFFQKLLLHVECLGTIAIGAKVVLINFEHLKVSPLSYVVYFLYWCQYLYFEGDIAEKMSPVLDYSKSLCDVCVLFKKRANFSLHPPLGMIKLSARANKKKKRLPNSKREKRQYIESIWLSCEQHKAFYFCCFSRLTSSLVPSKQN